MESPVLQDRAFFLPRENEETTKGAARGLRIRIEVIDYGRINQTMRSTLFLKTASISLAAALVAGAYAVGAVGTVGALADNDRDRDGDRVTQMRDVGEFSKIRVEGALEIEINVGGRQSLEVSTDADHIDRVETTVRGNMLTISMRGRRWRNANVEISINMAALDQFDIEGAADAYISGVDSETFEITVDGAGDIYLEGKCGSAEFTINGAGDLEAQDFECKAVAIQINGAGDADVYASESIDAEINGVGDIDVYGNPKKVRQKISGLGDIELK